MTLPGLGSLPTFAEAARSCSLHRDRLSVALCRSCGRGGCGECLTKVDGVNRCAVCLLRNYPVVRLPPALARSRRSRASVPRSLLRRWGAFLLYSLVALAAATVGVTLPFAGNERRLAENRQRVAEVALAVSTYHDELGRYPPAERGLAALLVAGSEDSDKWHGPYVLARPANGEPPRSPQDAGKVLDLFGRPIVYYASPRDPEDLEADPSLVYLASPGADGKFETPGVGTGNLPHEPTGDDVLQWIVSP